MHKLTRYEIEQAIKEYCDPKKAYEIVNLVDNAIVEFLLRPNKADK
jgi:hypothetical protein